MRPDELPEKGICSSGMRAMGPDREIAAVASLFWWVHVAAQTAYEEALPLYRKVGNVLGEADCSRKLKDLDDNP